MVLAVFVIVDSTPDKPHTADSPAPCWFDVVAFFNRTRTTYIMWTVRLLCGSSSMTAINRNQAHRLLDQRNTRYASRTLL